MKLYSHFKVAKSDLLSGFGFFLQEMLFLASFWEMRPKTHAFIR